MLQISESGSCVYSSIGNSKPFPDLNWSVDLAIFVLLFEVETLKQQKVRPSAAPPEVSLTSYLATSYHHGGTASGKQSCEQVEKAEAGAPL
jgi:hypothetical protein